jgi:hypothetical protein
MRAGGRAAVALVVLAGTCGAAYFDGILFLFFFFYLCLYPSISLLSIYFSLSSYLIYNCSTSPSCASHFCQHPFPFSPLSLPPSVEKIERRVIGCMGMIK